MKRISLLNSPAVDRAAKGEPAIIQKLHLLTLGEFGHLISSMGNHLIRAQIVKEIQNRPCLKLLLMMMMIPLLNIKLLQKRLIKALVLTTTTTMLSIVEPVSLINLCNLYKCLFVCLVGKQHRSISIVPERSRPRRPVAGANVSRIHMVLSLHLKHHHQYTACSLFLLDFISVTFFSHFHPNSSFCVSILSACTL